MTSLNVAKLFGVNGIFVGTMILIHNTGAEDLHKIAAYVAIVFLAGLIQLVALYAPPPKSKQSDKD